MIFIWTLLPPKSILFTLTFRRSVILKSVRYKNYQALGHFSLIKVKHSLGSFRMTYRNRNYENVERDKDIKRKTKYIFFQGKHSTVIGASSCLPRSVISRHSNNNNIWNKRNKGRHIVLSEVGDEWMIYCYSRVCILINAYFKS